MTSLREKKKEEVRQKILDVSGELFLENGFEETSTDQIAEKAGIGAGTVYNYFKSKTELFIESLAGMVHGSENHLFEQAEGKMKDSSPAEIIVELIESSLKTFMKLPKPIVKELTLASFNLSKSKPKIFKKLLDYDYKYMKKLTDLLDKLKESGKLDTEVGSYELVEIIYGALMFEFGIYIYEDITYEDFKGRVSRKLEIILKGK